MDDFLITNGEVSFEHKYPRAEYDSAIPRVAYSFTIAEGSDPAVVTAKVMLMAVQAVEAAAHGKADELARAYGIGKEQFSGSHLVPTPVEVIPEPIKHVRPRRVPNQVEPAGSPTLVPEAAPSVTSLVPAEDTGPAAAPTPTPSVVSLVPNDAVIDAADEDADLLGLPQEDQPAEVTDKQLQDLAMPISAKLRFVGGNVSKLRELISAAGGGSVLTTIPQEKRADFVVAAKALLASL